MTLSEHVRHNASAGVRRTTMIRRHLEHFRAATTDSHPDGPRFLPASEYLDPTILAAERALFRSVPLVATHSSALPKEHSFTTEEIDGVPVLFIRQADGSVKAFLNVCSHRGAQVATGEGVVERRMFCPYHGWSYSPAGELLSVMQEETFGPIEKACNSLTELPCAERAGLVFVMLDPYGTMDLDDFLGSLGGHVDDAGLDRLVLQDHHTEKQPINWKLALTTFLEAYHVKIVHRDTVGTYFVGNMATHDLHGVDGQHSFTSWTMSSIVEIAAGGADAADVVEVAPYLPLIYIHPNTFVTSPEFVDLALLVRIFPGAEPNRQHTDFRVFTGPGMTDEQRAMSEQFGSVSIYALENEDYKQAMDVQRSLDSGLCPGIQVGANEPAVTDMHRALARAVGRPQPDMPLPTEPNRIRTAAITRGDRVT